MSARQPITEQALRAALSSAYIGLLLVQRRGGSTSKQIAEGLLRLVDGAMPHDGMLSRLRDEEQLLSSGQETVRNAVGSEHARQYQRLADERRQRQPGRQGEPIQQRR